MIFVTVGTQLPFDRLVRSIDEWAGRSGRSDVFAQIGDTEFRPSHIQWAPFLSPGETAKRISDANVIVAHAGMGTIIAGLEAAKPIIVFPRRADLGEHRNDHQLATARRFGERGLVRVATESDDLSQLLDRAGEGREVAGADRAPRERLMAFLRDLLSRIND